MQGPCTAMAVRWRATGCRRQSPGHRSRSRAAPGQARRSPAALHRCGALADARPRAAVRADVLPDERHSSRVALGARLLCAAAMISPRPPEHATTRPSVLGILRRVDLAPPERRPSGGSRAEKGARCRAPEADLLSLSEFQVDQIGHPSSQPVSHPKSKSSPPNRVSSVGEHPPTLRPQQRLTQHPTHSTAATDSDPGHRQAPSLPGQRRIVPPSRRDHHRPTDSVRTAQLLQTKPCSP